MLGTIPQGVEGLIDVSPARLHALFSIGVSDIGSLQSGEAAAEEAETSDQCSPGRWIACTTDSVLACKTGLFDVLITLESDDSESREVHECQRADYLPQASLQVVEGSVLRDDEPVSETDVRHFLRICGMLETCAEIESDRALLEAARQRAIEGWLARRSLLMRARDGFLWWASGGQLSAASSLRDEQGEIDTGDDLIDAGSRDDDNSSSGSFGAGDELPDARVELVRHFHRMTARLLAGSAALLETTAGPQTQGPADDDGRDPSSASAAHVRVSRVDVARVTAQVAGSASDTAKQLRFLQALCAVWFPRAPTLTLVDRENALRAHLVPAVKSCVAFARGRGGVAALVFGIVVLGLLRLVL